MAYFVQYQRDCANGKKFVHIRYPWSRPGFATRAEAALLMAGFTNPEEMEIVED